MLKINPVSQIILSVFLSVLLVSCDSDEKPEEPIEPPIVSEKEEETVGSDTSAKADNWTFSEVTVHTGLVHKWGLQNRSEGPDIIMEDLFSGGVAVGDFNSDGLEDIFIDSGNIETSKLYKNLGDNSFEDVTKEAGVQIENHRGSGPIFEDVNGDGWLDLFIGGVSGDGNFLFLNNKDGTFTDITNISGLDMVSKNTISTSFGDFNRDGFLDIAFGHWGDLLREDTETIFKGYGTGTFISVPDLSGVSAVLSNSYTTGIEGIADYSFSPTFADLNNDGWPDLTLVSDFAYSRYFMNDSFGHFILPETSNLTVKNGMGTALGDYDNDGDLDWFVTAIYEVSEFAISSPGNRLYENKEGTFEDATFTARVEDGGWAWGACFADFNNDGYLDIFHTNGWTEVSPIDPDVNNYLIDPSRLFISNGNKQFAERAVDFGITDFDQGRAVVCFDSDNDGDIDLLVINNGDTDNSFIFYENKGANEVGNYLTISLKGAGSNTSAVGARAYLTIGETTQMRELISGGNFTSQVSFKLHFGLKDAETIDTLRIVWPDQNEQTFFDVSVNQHLQIEQE